MIKQVHKSMIRIVLVVVVACAMMAPSEVPAWVTIGPTWGGANTTMSLNLGATSWNSSAEDALFRWNNIGATNFRFFVNNDNKNHCERGTFCLFTDGNAVEWENFADGVCSDDPSGALAITRLNWAINFCNADVLFNNQYSWTTSCRDHTTNSPFEFNTVAIHEFGHALGLDHDNRWVATMNCIYHANCHRVHGDDRAGNRALYGSGSYTDLTLTNWVKTDNSCNTATRLVNGPSSATCGQVVTVETTMENYGTTSHSFDIRWYLSTNDVISTADTVLGTNLGASVGAGGTFTFSRDLTIPNVATGTYWIGAIIDINNAVAEADEGNNALAQPRSISITCPTNTPTNTPSNTPSNTPTNTFTNTPTNTFTNTATPTNTFTNTATPTNTFTNTATPTNTSTRTPTPTSPLAATPRWVCAWPGVFNDADNDNIKDAIEFVPPDNVLTNRYLWDSDGDGLSDGFEDANASGAVESGELHPRRRDSDNDRIWDGVEVMYLGSDPLDAASPGGAADNDLDGLPLGLDPDETDVDYDDDRFTDGIEAVMVSLDFVKDPGVWPALGDVDCRFGPTNLDALIIQSIQLGLTPHGAVPGETNGDVNRDGSASNLDSLIVQSWFLNLPSAPVMPLPTF